MNDENAQIKFRDNLVIDIPVDTTVEDKSSVSVNKTAGNVDPETGEVVFTIEVKAGESGTTNPVELVDVMSGINLVGDITVDRDSSTYTKTPNSDGSGFNIKFNDKMSPNEVYKITYTAKFPEGSNTSTADVTANNTITAKIKKDDGTILEIPKTVPVTYSQKYLSKSGSLSADKNSITWTITINEGRQNIGGWTLDDSLNGIRISDQLPLTMRSSDGSSIVIDALPFKFPDNASGSYTIEYTTPAEVPLNGHSASNKVSLKDHDKDPIEVEANVDVNSWGQYNPLKKEALSYNVNGNGTVDVKYKVTINADKGSILAPWTYNDSLGENQYFTEAQKQAIINTLSTALSPGTYSINWTHTGTNCTGFTITFTNTLPRGEQIVFDYAATGTISDPDKEQEFKNNANINNIVYGGDSIKYAPLVQKHDNDRWHNPTTEYDYKNKGGILKWKVIVAPPNGYMGGPLTVTEHLPEGVDLQKLELKDSYSNQNIDIAVPNTYYFSSYAVTTAKSGQDVIITIPENFVKAKETMRFEFYIEVKINDDVQYDEIKDGKPAHSFVNSVDVSSGDGETTGTKVQTQVITKDETLPILTKTHGAYNGKGTTTFENNVIPYSITVNPEGKDLIDGTDTLSLIDTIISSDTNKYTINLVPGSLVVYNINKDGSKGTPLSPTKYGYHLGPNNVNGTKTEYVIKMTIPDKTPLIIEYKYKINTDYVGQHDTITNSAYLVGVAESPKKDDSVYMVFADSIAVATTSGMTLVKVDSTSDGIALEGARFALYVYSKEKDDYIPAIDDKTKEEIILTTPKNGIVYINDVKFNTAYKLVELDAPELYIKAKEPYYFWLPHEDKTAHPEEKPDNFAGNTHSGGDILYFANEKMTTEIEVVKQWVDEKTGNDVTADRNDSIQFELWRNKYIGSPPGGGGNGVTVEWSVKYHGNLLHEELIKVKDEDGNDVVPPAGSIIKITANATAQISSDNDYPKLKVNGIDAQWTIEDATNGIISYQFVADKDTVIVIESYAWQYPDNKVWYSCTVTPPQTSGSDEPIAELVPGVGPFTLSKANDWHTEIDKLKKFEVLQDAQGKDYTVYYTYFVREINADAISDIQTVTYSENNATGITTGTLTITNTVDTAPKHELPQTGGSGTTKFLSAGAGLMLIALLALLRKPKISAGGCRSS